MALAQIAQDDFSAGVIVGTAPDVQPGVGVYQALNALFNDDGDAYRRGGVVYVDAHPPLTQAILWTWSGYLEGLPIELHATHDTLYHGATVIGGITPIDGPIQVAAFENVIYLPNGQKVTSAGGVLTIGAWTRPAALPADGELHVANVIGRLVVGCGNRVAFSGSPAVGAPIDPEHFDPTDFHKLGAGVIVMGLAPITDTCLVFTNWGLSTITNMAYDLTDAAGNIQQSLNLVTPGLSLVHEAGLCPYQNAIVAPCIDRIYLVDGINPPIPISNGIAPTWVDLVGQGYLPGGAKVFNQTLFLPVVGLPLIVPGDSWQPGVIQHVFACRLSRPVKGRVLYYPWSELTGHVQTCRHFDVSLVNGYPQLVGAGNDGKLADLTPIFTPTAANKTDVGGGPIEFTLETRDFPTGQGQPNHLRRIRLRYTAKGAGNITAAYSSDRAHSVWTALPAQALTDGKDPVSWWLQHAARVRYVRVRFTTSDPLESFVVHRVELQPRSATHAR